MARPLRVAFPDAIYHVMARRHENQKLFIIERDYTAFRERLKTAVERFKLNLYAYCLMPTHYHLFLSTPLANLSQSMQWLNTAYTVWFNRRHQHKGHLLQGRFKAKLVEDDAYFGELSRYIHLNPVRAEIVEKPEEWRWSSYPGYWRKANEEPFVTYERVLKTYSSTPRQARRQYRVFVDAGMNVDLQDPWRSAWHGFVLGSEAFIDKISRLIDKMPLSIEQDIPLVRHVKRRFSIHDIQSAVATAANITVDDLRRPRRGTNDYPRKVGIYLCRMMTNATGQSIANEFGMKSDGSLAKLASDIQENGFLVKRTLKLLKCEMEA
jgi:REP element-mobilizing transposase RayT